MLEDAPFRMGTAVLTPRSRTRKRRDPPPGVPPGRRDGRGGGGGGDEREREAGGEGAGSFALALALAGITTLFVVLIAVWLFLLRPSEAHGTARGPLNALWTSTACLVASSIACERAARAARRGATSRETRGWLVASALLGLAFLGAQARLWTTAWSAGLVPASGGFAAVFFALTGLHALHVLVGLAILGALTLRLRGGAARPATAHGVRLGAVYWHFMGAVWLVLFTLLYVVR